MTVRSQSKKLKSSLDIFRWLPGFEGLLGFCKNPNQTKQPDTEGSEVSLRDWTAAKAAFDNGVMLWIADDLLLTSE